MQKNQKAKPKPGDTSQKNPVGSAWSLASICKRQRGPTANVRSCGTAFPKPSMSLTASVQALYNTWEVLNFTFCRACGLGILISSKMDPLKPYLEGTISCQGGWGEDMGADPRRPEFVIQVLSSLISWKVSESICLMWLSKVPDHWKKTFQWSWRTWQWTSFASFQF